MYEKKSYKQTDFSCDKQTYKQKVKNELLSANEMKKNWKNDFSRFETHLKWIACWERMDWNRKTKEKISFNIEFLVAWMRQCF